MTELVACIIGWMIGTFFVGIVVVAFILCIYAETKEGIDDRKNRKGSGSSCKGTS